MKLNINRQSLYQSLFSLRLSVIYIAVFILLFGVGAETSAQTGSYTTIDVPGSMVTSPNGINTAGDIVGGYQDSNGKNRGFKLSNGIFTTIDPPGYNGGTSANGINTAGDIVGHYSDGRGHGFKLSNGVFTTIDLPGSSFTSAYGINNAGDIVGQYGNDKYRSFKLSNGVFTTIDPPGSTGTFAQGINNAGDVVGYYTVSNYIYHGFKLSNGVFTIIDPPGSLSTEVYGINTAGDIVGHYRDSSVSGSFKLSNGVFTTIDVPGSGYTSANGINAAGDIVGGYGDSSGKTHGFKLTNGSTTLAATVQANPIGRSFTVDGATYNSPQTFNWQSGSSHIIGTNSPQTGTAGTQYVWSNWSDGGAITHTVSPTASVNYTASFTTQYQTTVQTNPSGRSFTVDGVTYNSTQIFNWEPSSTHTIGTNSPQTGSIGTQYVWSNWSDGGAISHTVSPTANSTYTANFTTPVPVVSEVIREFPGVFLTGFDKTNIFDVRVDWKGTTGKVRFQINDGTPFEVTGTSAGAVKAFNLINDFTAGYAPSTIKITPINGGGTVGETKTEVIYVFPYPTWLTFALSTDASALSFTTQPGEIRANFKVKYPNPEFKASGRFDENIPFIGGELGIAKAQGTFTGYASSLGTGSLTLGGETKFRAFGQELSGGANGTGNFLLNQNGLSVTGASLNLNVAGTVSREVSLVTAIPALAPFRRFPVVRAFTDTVTLRGEASPSVAFATTWKQDPITRDLVFNEATGTIGLNLKGIITSKINDHFKFQGWVAGGGNFVIGTPSPYLRSASINFEAGSQLNIDGFFGGQEFAAKVNYGCTITTGTNAAVCESSNSSNLLKATDYFNPQLKLIRPRYERFGKYESFKFGDEQSDKLIADRAISNNSAVNDTIVSNVFANAEPTMLPVGSNGKLLLYVRQNPNLPVLQSTDLAWSYYDGTSWTAPAVITNDTRADFSPVAGVNANGKIVAAWLKIKTPAFNTPVSTFDDLPLYYKQVEVVSAVFDPTTRTWSSETSLTNDAALDTSLRMAKDSNGNLLLTWQSNPSGEFTADSANPATLKYSFWNGSGWNAPAVVASNLSNIGEHAVAIKGNNAFIVFSSDPDINVSNDSKLAVYKWNGISWSQGTVFAAGNIDNQSPNAAYDITGNGQVIWLKGADLVQANLVDSTPQIVRQGSQSTAFYNIRLLNNQRDNFTLIWQEVVDNNPANIFAKIYNPASNTWSDDRRLNQEEWQSKDANGYYDARGNLQLVYLATEILRVTQTTTINGQTYQIPNIPQDGQTDLRLLTVNQTKTIFDFDGDGKADVSVFRPDNGAWYLNQSANGFTGSQFGVSTDKIVPADYDGDGKTDIAVYRSGTWYLNRSQSGFTGVAFGDGNDIPQPADFDGDGKAEIAVWRPSNGTWYVLNLATNQFNAYQFGASTDKPVVGDYDGDGKADYAVYRPSNGTWYLQRSTAGFTGMQFGDANDKPVAADYDGDGKTDVAVFRPSNGTWYLLRSQSGFTGVQFGISSDLPTPADYDGDGKADIAVFRSGTWYLNRSTAGFTGIAFGASTDKPVPNAFVP